MSPPSPARESGTTSTDPNQRLEELLARLDRLPAAGRELAQECVASVLELHGEGLGRVLELIENEPDRGQPILEALQHDKLVRSLLLIHGLHPQSLESRLREALDQVRPYMQSHGGNVELLSLDKEVARLRFHGTCQTCPSSAVTLELAIRRAVEEACPDLAGLELDNATEAGAAPAKSNQDEPHAYVPGHSR
jgi:Fe-S cluster biogenesis protein NfuA